jgi:multidrug efflux pump subunit AcrA (membrane-fusion protein)
MKSTMIIFLMILATSCFASTAYSQTKQSAVETVQDLKLQLIELDARQETAKLQVQQLEDALKPENIELSLAGVGSTKPEELREQRRRQLLIEKKAADAQLEQLTLKRTQLETALSAAEVQAYQQSAAGPGIENSFRGAFYTTTWLLALGLLAILVIAVVACVSVLLRMQAIERALR